MSPPQKPSAWQVYGPTLALGAAFLTFWALLRLFPLLQKVSFLGFVGVLLALTLRYPVSVLGKFMPRPLAMLTTMLAVLAALAGTVAAAVPLVRRQVKMLIEGAPRAIGRMEEYWENLWGDGVRNSPSVLDRLTGEATALLSRAIPVAVGTLSVVGELLLVLILAMFLAYRPEAYTRGFLRLFPPEKGPTLSLLLDRVGVVLRSWVVGTLVSMAVVGLFTTVGLLLLGVESWLALGLLSFAGELVPFLGPLFAALLGTAVALAQSPDIALRAGILYVVIQQFEGNLLIPLVMKQAVRIQPGLLILWQLVFLQAFGLLGLFVSTPLLAALRTVVNIGFAERVLGHSADDEA